MSAYCPLTDHYPRLLQMSNHTINSWKKYCLYHKNAIEDLRRRAISNAEKKAISKGATDATVTEDVETTLPVPQQVDPQQHAPHQLPPPLIVPPQSIPQPTIPQPTTPQPAVPQPTIPQQAALQPTISQRATPQLVASQQQTPQPTPQPVVPQQATSTTAHESQQSPPREKVSKSGPVSVKTEPLDEDQLDFAFVTEVLSGWKPNEESDAALWKRMETMVCSLVFSLGLRAPNPRFQRPSATASSWEAFCEKHWSRFEHFFEVKPT